MQFQYGLVLGHVGEVVVFSLILAVIIQFLNFGAGIKNIPPMLGAHPVNAPIAGNGRLDAFA